MATMTGLKRGAMVAVLLGLALSTLAGVTRAEEATSAAKNQETLATSPLKTVLIDPQTAAAQPASSSGNDVSANSSGKYYSGVVWNCTRYTVNYQISMDGVRWTNQSLASGKAMAYYYEKSYRGQMTPVKVRYDHIWNDGKTTYSRANVMMKWCNRPIDGLLHKFLLFDNRSLTLRITE